MNSRLEKKTWEKRETKERNKDRGIINGSRKKEKKEKRNEIV